MFILFQLQLNKFNQIPMSDLNLARVGKYCERKFNSFEIALYSPFFSLLL